MFDKMKQMMEMKKQADQIKKELDQIEVEVEEVRGIKIKINGSQIFQSIEVDEKHLDPSNQDKFQKSLLRSVNAAIKKSQMTAAQKMRQNMPAGMF